MRKSVIFTALAVLLALIGVVSCSFGLEPVWKITSHKTSLSMTFAIPTATGARAIAPGAGYLYIRTIGGPVGEKGPSYGPYPITGGNFVTTDIPPGEYAKLGVIVAVKPLEGQTFADTTNKTTYTFEQVIGSSDAEFEQYSSGPNSPFNELVGGVSTGHLFTNVVIKEGLINKLEAILTPMIGSTHTATAGSTSQYMGLPETVSTALEKRFIKLANPNKLHDQLNISISSNSPDATVKTLGVYSMEGKQVSLTTPNKTFNGNETFKLPFAGGDHAFLYIEYSGTLSLFFISTLSTPVTTANTLNVNFTFDPTIFPGSSFDGKKMFIGVYNSADLSGDGPPSNPPVGVGLAILTKGAASITVPIQINEFGTDTPANIAVGTSLEIMGFIDMSNRYSYTTTAAISDISGMEPRYGDYSTDKMNTPVSIHAGPNNYNLAQVDLEKSTKYILYVSQAGGGNGLFAPTTLDNALSTEIPPEASEVGIHLVENINVASDIVINRSIYITSNGPTPYTIFDTRTASPTPFIKIEGVSTEPSGVHLHNVIIDGNNTERSTAGVWVTNSGQLGLREGSVIQNFINTSNTYFGGGVYVNTGTMYIHGGSIKNNTAIHGGGVYVDHTENYFSHITLESGEISGNTATFGGGVYLQSNTTMEIRQGFPAPLITTNTAKNTSVNGEGGGVYIKSGALLNDPFVIRESVITGNIADVTGTENIGGTGVVSEVVKQMFVSETGIETNSGAMSSDPTTFAKALNTTTVHDIILMSDIPLSSAITINRNINIKSKESTRYTIYPTTSIVGALITVQTGSSAPNPPNRLSLHNVAIGPKESSSLVTAYSLVNLQENTALDIGNEAILQNNASTSSDGGGAVYNAGGIVSLNGGTISGCSAVSGGGIYAQSGTIIINSGIIEYNSATAPTGAGGGIYAGNGVYLNLNYDAANAYWISNNKANLGGGIYYESGDFFIENPIDSASARVQFNTKLDEITASNIEGGA